MTDAAAFFANKKKKKKTFKFNANKIDASTITSTVHVDSPALSKSTDAVTSTIGALSSMTIVENGASSVAVATGSAMTNGGDDETQWDDEALAAKTSRKGIAVAVPSGVTTKELAETKALDLKTQTGGNEEKDLAEKFRVEETRAKLVAAREGMEREGQRIKEEKEKKEQKEVTTASRFGNAAAGLSSTSSVAGAAKWVPSRLRAGGSGGWGVKATSQTNVDTEDENLFPDLLAADAILEKQKQKEQTAFKAPKKTPIGGGATWAGSSATATATRPKLNLKKKTQKDADQVVKEERTNDEGPSKIERTPVTVAETSDTASPAPINNESAATTTKEASTAAAPTTEPAPIKPKKKKKKKDISTFSAKK